MKNILKITSAFILFIFSGTIFSQVEYTTSGSGGAYDLAYPANISTLTNGLSFTFKADHANTGAASLNVNTLGPITIKKGVNIDLDPNDIIAGQVVTVVYDGTNFQMITASGNVGSGSIPSTIQDTDGNTKVVTDFAGNGTMDDIRFHTGGTEHFRMTGSRLEVLNSNTSVIIGQNAGLTAGSQNVAIGYDALGSSTGTSNTAVGFRSNWQGTGGANSTYGFNSGFQLSTGTFNTLLGYQAGSALTTGGQNTIVGGYANVASPGLYNATAIGFEAMVGADNSMVLGSINGVNGATADTKVGIGTTTPNAILDLGGDLNMIGMSTAPSPSNSGEGKIYFDGPSNAFMVSENGGAWTNLLGGGGMTAAGSDGDVQFNSGGVLNGSAALRWDNTNQRLGIGTNSPQERLEVQSGNILMDDGYNITWGIVPAPYIQGNDATDYLAFGTSGGEKMRITSGGQVGIGGLPNVYAALDVSSSSMGVMLPRLNSVQESGLAAALGGGDEGMIIYSLTDATYKYFDGVAFVSFGGLPGGDFYSNGSVAMTGNFQTGGNFISNDGDSEGLSIASNGQSTFTPATTGAGNTAIASLGDIRTTGLGTGIYFSNTSIGVSGNDSNLGQLYLKTGATNRVVISSNGSVNINTPSAGTALNVAGDISIQTEVNRITRGGSGGDMVPVAYGVYDGELDVLHANATEGDVSVTHISSGAYDLTYNGSRDMSGVDKFQLNLTVHYGSSSQMLVTNYMYLGGSTVRIFVTDLTGNNTEGTVSFELRIK
ncbi:MAG: hypothetical protein H6599_03090 [Flavobacteriales bacterium]|nr:hypothetical protein [Flavobacteriales bacterium]